MWAITSRKGGGDKCAGGKEHEAPCHHKLETYLDEYIAAAGSAGETDGALFRTTGRTTGTTGYLKAEGASLSETRKMANPADTRTTQLYDRRGAPHCPVNNNKVGI